VPKPHEFVGCFNHPYPFRYLPPTAPPNPSTFSAKK
jgi:hypothetical protein